MDLRRYYGLTLAGLAGDVTLNAALRERLGSDLEVGSSLETGGVLLRVRELHAGRVKSVGVAILPHGTSGADLHY